MAQGNLIFPTSGTVSGLALVSQLNNAFSTAISLQYGATDPATLPGWVEQVCWWADPAHDKLKLRYPAANTWLNIAPLSVSYTAGLTSDAQTQITTAVPAGSMMHWPKSTPPTGWLVRDGSALNRTTYAALYSVLGTTYGAGDGSSTFNLPDDRGLIHAGYKSGDAAFGTFGASYGSKDAINVSHNHTASSSSSTSVTISDPGHSHPVTSYGSLWSADGGDALRWSNTTTRATESSGTGISASASTSTSTSVSSSGASGTNANIQPSRIYLPIIKY